MSLETTLLAIDNYEIASLVDKKVFYELYLFEDADGYISLETAKLDSFNVVASLINFLFKGHKPLTELYKRVPYVIIDLTNCMRDAVDFDHLDMFYLQWLTDTGRENTMDEYGMLIGFIGYIQRHKSKRNLLMIVEDH